MSYVSQEFRRVASDKYSMLYKMFEKHNVAFTNRDIFGRSFRPAVEASFCVVSKMLFSGKIETDGTIDLKNEVMLSKKELWSYVYYLFYHNHMNIPVFKGMKSPKDGKASAELFYAAIVSFVDGRLSVKSVKPVDLTALILFINGVIRDYKELINPVFDYLKVLLTKTEDLRALTNISGISLITGVDGKSGFKIVTSPNEVANANVKISIASA